MHVSRGCLILSGLLLGCLGPTGALTRGKPAESGAEIVALDLRPGPESSEPRFMTGFDDRVIFSADDGVHGRELWISDGSAAGTRMLADIQPGPQGSNPSPGGEGEANPVPADARTRFTRVGDRVYFLADDGKHGPEIWTSDGSATGTRLLADVTEGPEAWGLAAFLTEHDGRLFFTGDDGENGEELWVSDGTAEGTRMLADILDGPAGSLPAHLRSTPLGLAFSAENDEAGIEPWLSDGSPEGTRMLADIAAGLDGSEPDSFVGFNSRLVFAASDAPGGANMEPWISDGSAAGTRVLRDLNPGGRGFNQGFAPHAGRLYFGGDDGGGGELWVTDGEPDGTHAVFASAMRGRGSVPAGFVSFGNLLFFQAFHFSYGIEPWVSDGTEPGTRLLADVNPGEVASSFPAEASPLGDRLYFSADREGLGRELWVTDGTTAETRVVSDLRPGALGSDPSALLAQAEQLYFAASDPALGDELRVLGPESAPSGTPQATPPAPTTRPPGETPPAQSGRILLPRLDRGVQP